MIRGLIRYLAFVLVAATLIYGGYRMLTPATTKTTASEKAEKEHSDRVVLSDASTLLIHETETGLRGSNTLLCRHSVPLGGFCVVLSDALPVFIHKAEVVLRR